jgi:predicted ferric reductase
MRRGLLVRQGLWSLAFLAVILVPLVLSVNAGGKADFTVEVSTALGVLAASVLVCVLILPSRLRSLTATFGIERVLLSHRTLGLLTLVLVLGHLGMLILDDRHNATLLVPWLAPPRARAATAATVALLAMCLLAVFRRRLGHRYETWRWAHVVLGIVVVVGSTLHVYWLHHLTQDQAMRRWFELAIGLVVLLFGYRWVGGPMLATRRAYVIDEVRPESETVSTLALRPLRHRHRGLTFDPGQFAWIRLDRPMGPREEHPFTIASGAHRPRELEFTIRNVGDYTAMLARLVPGRRVYVDGPHGTFTVDARRANGLVLIAGGVGITPMMSMLRTLEHRRDQRRHVLVTAARHSEDLLFRDEIARLSGTLTLTVVEVVSAPTPDWRGLRGRVDAELLASVLPRRRDGNRFDVFICGPGPMVDGVLTALDTVGVPAARIHTEQFDMA